MLRSLLTFIRLIISHRQLMVSMAKRDLAAQYVGSLLGFVWTFVHPLVLIFVFWIVFDLGFRVTPNQDVPFVVWLTAGLAAWFVFSEIVGGTVGILVANANLIKKTVFPSQILPVAKIIGSSITHVIFLIVLLGLIVFQKLPFSLYYLQFIYYFIGMAVFALGFAWAMSALNVFIRDIGQIVGVILQVGMWATPILWDINIMPLKVQTILKLNPMFYVVQGYRDSFLYFTPFWAHPKQTIYFWCVAGFMFLTGAIIFKKLKPQFADVL